MKKLYIFSLCDKEIFRCAEEDYSLALRDFALNFIQLKQFEAYSGEVIILRSFEFISSGGLGEGNIEGFLIDIDRIHGCFNYCPSCNPTAIDIADVYTSFCKEV